MFYCLKVENCKKQKVVSRKRTHDEKMLIGQAHSNPISDSRIYNVEFPDGGIGEFTTNTIADSLYSSLDDEGYNYGILEGIIGHQSSPEAVKRENGFYS